MQNSEYGIWYDDYAEFAEDQPDLAEALLNDVGEGEWQDEQIFYYPSYEDLADYELREGWYIDCGFDRIDFNGAPNPIDYIDLDALGKALVRTGDSSVYWDNGKEVVTTSCGW